MDDDAEEDMMLLEPIPDVKLELGPQVNDDEEEMMLLEPIPDYHNS